MKKILSATVAIRAQINKYSYFLMLSINYDYYVTIQNNNK
jgi:hypothetical protein